MKTYVIPASEQPHHIVGPVLYSLSEVARGVGATQPPVVATVHQPVKDTGPPTPGPVQAVAGKPDIRLRRCFLQPFKGPLGRFLFSGDLVRAGLELLGPRVPHSLPSHSVPRFCLSICFPRVFAKCKPVCLVCFFLNSFPLARLCMKVHVHSVPTLSSLAMPRPTPSLLGLRPPQSLWLRFPFPTGKGLCSVF